MVRPLIHIRCPLTQKSAHQYISQIISIDRNPVIELRSSEPCAVRIGPKITLFDSTEGLVCIISRHRRLSRLGILESDGCLSPP